jgi:hypothetical protein
MLQISMYLGAVAYEPELTQPEYESGDKTIAAQIIGRAHTYYPVTSIVPA